jgi:hypothetical protein
VLNRCKKARLSPALFAVAIAGAPLAALLAAATPAHAAPVDLIQNGDFTDTTAYYTGNSHTDNGNGNGGNDNGNGQSVTYGSNLTDSNLTGWTVSGCSAKASSCGYQFLAPTNSTANYGTDGVYDRGGNGVVTFYSTPGAAPGGGNAIMSDPVYETAGISQSVAGLTIGDTYTLSFYEASMQQTGYTGAEKDSWQVSFGTSTQDSTTMNNPSKGSTSWVEDTMTFVANAASEFLTFYATTSTTNAQPPFLLLADVSLTDTTPPPSDPVPEPATLGIVMLGVAGVFAARKKRSI